MCREYLVVQAVEVLPQLLLVFLPSVWGATPVEVFASPPPCAVLLV
jgi:hypothetical protein